MKIERIVAGNLQTNGYFLYDSQTSKGYIIDPDDSADVFLEKVKQISLKIKGIILTHHHYDHRGAVEGIRAKMSCPLYIHEDDKDKLPIEANMILKSRDSIFVGETEFHVVHTPGHTMGSICLISEKENIAFTGDTIFNVDLGRTDLADGSPDEMRRSIKEIISNWKDEVVIYPGHGDPCTMAYVRKHNREYIDMEYGL
jgi:glyoxylase-like metal-dependent hydrolase (beta-lactamase superfamily II)